MTYVFKWFCIRRATIFVPGKDVEQRLNEIGIN
jgi:hypothetical protein